MPSRLRSSLSNSGSMSGTMLKKLTIFLNNSAKYWRFDFEVCPTNFDGFARGVRDELEQQRRFFDNTKPHS